jgi:hypothetical protein
MTLTEAEWLGLGDPDGLLRFLYGKATERKLRLYGAACCRRIWAHLPGPAVRHVVEAVEHYADGDLGYDELDASCPGDWCGVEPLHLLPAPEAAVAYCTANPPLDAVRWTSEMAARVDRGGYAAQAEFLRDIFGNPFRPVTIPPAVLAWNDATVVRLAQAAYEGRQLPSGLLDNARLAVLADSLEEAGCTNSDILAHCRHPGPHVRGCWAVDLILAKE